MSEGMEQSLDATREELQQFLRRPEMDEAVRYAEQCGLNEPQVASLLDAIAARSDGAALPDATPLLGRWMLAKAALDSLDRVPDLPVFVEVKLLLCKEFRFFCSPGSTPAEVFLPGSREFRSMAAVARLRRFISGQVHWEVSGIPRRWLLEMRWWDALRILAVVARMGAFAPCFEAHIPSRGSPFLLEREYRRSYVRMANSMELQPEIRGVMGRSWMHSDETMQISPHLAWMNRLILDNGGIIVHMGPAAEDSGFLVGSPRRKELYESGAYRPRAALFLWPRKALLSWARREGSRTVVGQSAIYR